MLHQQLKTSITKLCTPETEVAQRTKFDDVSGAGACHLSEGETETFEVSKRTGLQQFRQIGIGEFRRKSQFHRSPLLLNDFDEQLLLTELKVDSLSGSRSLESGDHFVLDLRIFFAQFVLQQRQQRLHQWQLHFLSEPA